MWCEFAFYALDMSLNDQPQTQDIPRSTLLLYSYYWTNAICLIFVKRSQSRHKLFWFQTRQHKHEVVKHFSQESIVP